VSLFERIAFLRCTARSLRDTTCVSFRAQPSAARFSETAREGASGSLKPHVSAHPCAFLIVAQSCGQIVEFIRLLDCGNQICEYNQEQCRVTALNGKTSLIRSFPSKVSVSIKSATSNPRPTACRDTNTGTHTHTHQFGGKVTAKFTDLAYS